MDIREHVRTHQLNYDAFESANALCVCLVETGEYTIQFGAGHESTASQVLDLVRKHNVDIVIPEHGDIDHYGGIPTLRSDLDRAVTVAVPADDKEWFVDAGIEYDVILEDGDTRWGIEAMEMPGHTPGNMAFRFEDVLIAGDTLIGSDFPPIAVDDWSGAFGIAPPSRNTGGDAAARDSVRDLLEYDFEAVVVAHGSSIAEGGHSEVSRLVEDLDAGIERTEF